jgi:putative transposase
MYIVTAATLYKQPHFRGEERLALLQNSLFEVITVYGWELQAWAIFANHYHFIAQSPADATTLKRMIQRLHAQTARAINQRDGSSGRRVWFQYWDTCLTFEASYYARLNYVHNNAVHHGIVATATDYPFCSATWFQTHAPEELRTRVTAHRYDRIEIDDDFDT